jgi:deoxycytidylate deaminase
MGNVKRTIKSVDPQKSLLGDAVSEGGALNKIKALESSELVVALCGPIGSPIHEIADSIQQKLKDTYHYDTVEMIRLSGFICESAKQQSKKLGSGGVDEINALISHGDEMRRTLGHDILAKKAIQTIFNSRSASADSAHGELTETTKPRRVAHIVDSIKNQAELDLLRSVYGDMLYVVGVFSTYDDRVSRLRAEKSIDDAQIHTLIDRDSGEEIHGGMTVKKTFPLSDYFLRAAGTEASQIDKGVARFLDLILGNDISTPTRDEMAMYAAASSASHSACMSRQVGASVTTANGKVVATGWNDVPKYLGGLYDADDSPDLRCWNWTGTKCWNDEEKALVADELASLLTKNTPDGAAAFVSTDRLDELKQFVRKNSRLANIIEFSRSIHAEMHAILNALKTKEDIASGRVYVATYPCHNCARHIVAAGLSEVIYIEPYRKSLATKLHQDSISENESEKGKKVILQQYQGVAPSRFLTIFKQSQERKEGGKKIKNVRAFAEAKNRLTLEAIPRLEALVLEDLKEMS